MCGACCGHSLPELGWEGLCVGGGSCFGCGSCGGHYFSFDCDCCFSFDSAKYQPGRYAAASLFHLALVATNTAAAAGIYGDADAAPGASAGGSAGAGEAWGRCKQQPHAVDCENHHTAVDVPLLLYALPFPVRRKVAVAMSGEMLTGWERS